MRMTPALLMKVNKIKPKLNKNNRMAFEEKFMQLHHHRDLLELIFNDTVIKERFLSAIDDADEVLKCSSSSATDPLQPVTLGTPHSNYLKK
jgi:hypothetical protein